MFAGILAQACSGFAGLQPSVERSKLLPGGK